MAAAVQVVSLVMRVLVVGGSRERSSTGMTHWRGLDLQTARSQFDQLVRYNQHTPRMLPRVRRARVEAFSEAVRAYDAVVCETPEALLLAGEWRRRGLSPRPVAALEVEGLLRVTAMRRWYRHVGEPDPWPDLCRAPWMSWLVASSSQKELLAASGIPAERIFYEQGCTAHFGMFTPGIEAQLTGGDEDDAHLAQGLPVGGVLLPGGGRRDHVTALRAVAQLPELSFHLIDELLRYKKHQLRKAGVSVLPNLHWLTPLPLQRFVALVRRARLLVVALAPGLGDGGHTTIATAHRLGVPTVVSDVPGVADYVTDGVDARLVPPGDHGALAEAIAEIWADHTGSRGIVAAGRQREAERCRVAGEGLWAALRMATAGLASGGR